MSAAGQRERASKKKKLQVVFHTPQGPFLGGSTSVLRAGYCTVPEKHDAGIMRIGNCLNAYCNYLASRSYVTFSLASCNKNRKSEVEVHGCGLDLWSIWEA